MKRSDWRKRAKIIGLFMCIMTLAGQRLDDAEGQAGDVEGIKTDFPCIHAGQSGRMRGCLKKLYPSGSLEG